VSDTASKVNILFPVENMNREMDFRLFLACSHVKPSNRIFIGQHDVLYRMAVKTGMRSGVYVGKHLFRQLPAFKDYARYHAMKESQFAVIHLDEEGGLCDGDEDRWRWQLLEVLFDPRCLEAEDYICTWGDFQRDFYKSLNPRCSEHIIATGHPRFDLYKPAYRKYFDADVARITARYQDFILVNTKFVYGNNGLGLADTFSKRIGYDPSDLQKRLTFVARFAYEQRTMSDFVRLINHLSLRFPHVNIVVRPHQAEDWEFYRTIFRGIPNLHVVHEGTVGPWLLACKVLIHNSCTTGVEAYLTDTNLINYKSVVDAQHDLFLADIFGVQCFTDDEVVQNVEAMLKAGRSGPPPARFDDRAHSLMANFRQNSVAAFLQVIEEAEARQARLPQEWNPGRVGQVELSREMIDRAKSVMRPLFPAKQRQYKALRSNFLGLDRRTIERKVRTLEELVGKRVRTTFYSSALLSIETAT